MSHKGPLKGEAFHDASLFGPRESHNFRDGGAFSVYASVRIDAPPQAVYDAILAIDHWNEWNTFVPAVKVTKHPHSHTKHLTMMPGTFMTFTVQMTPSEQTTSKEVCTHVGQLKLRKEHPEHPVTHIRWSMDNANSFIPGFVVKAERTNEIEEAEDGTTLYRTWETFGGWASGKIRKKYGAAMRDRFAESSNELKAYVEKQQQEKSHS